MTVDSESETIQIIQNNLLLSASGISGSTTRTLTVPDANGTIYSGLCKCYISAAELDVQDMIQVILMLIYSEALRMEQIDTSGSGTTTCSVLDLKLLKH